MNGKKQLLTGTSTAAPAGTAASAFGCGSCWSLGTLVNTAASPGAAACASVHTLPPPNTHSLSPSLPQSLIHVPMCPSMNCASIIIHQGLPIELMGRASATSATAGGQEEGRQEGGRVTRFDGYIQEGSGQPE